MDSLMDVASGAYLVETRTALYVIDLNDYFVLRKPRASAAAVLGRDEDTIDLLEVRECTVGRPMVLRIDLHLASATHTERTTTTVQQILELEPYQ